MRKHLTQQVVRPEDLVDALQDRIHPSSGRLLASKPVGAAMIPSPDRSDLHARGRFTVRGAAGSTATSNGVIQPSLISDGWLELKDGDESARTIFDRHYSRRVYADGRKPKLFLGPGEKHPLMLADGRALFAWRKFKHDYGQTGVNCAIFRNEQSETKASQLIREAVAIARERWYPTERFYTYVDPREVQPVMVRGIPCFGFCFWKAGWSFAGVGRGRKFVWALEPAMSVDAVDPVNRGSSE